MSPIAGTEGDDSFVMVLEDEDVTILALGGNDYVELDGGGMLEVYGGAGNDEIDIDSAERIYIEGGEGNDVIWAALSGQAEIHGGAGDDDINAYQLDTVRISGGAGRDSIGFGHLESAFVDGGSGNDALYLLSVDSGILRGGGGNDYFEFWDCGTELVAVGGSGNDVYYLARLHHPTIVEAEDGGIDTVRVRQESYTADENIENIEYEEVIDEHGDHEDPPDIIIGNELGNRIEADGDNVGARIEGRGGDDYIEAWSGSFVINGDSGDDVILSHGEGDRLRGGSGNDRLEAFSYYDVTTMEGGTGSDVFVADNSGFSYEETDSLTEILDFNGAQDRIELIDFEGLGADGVLAARYFYAGTGVDVVAQDSNDRIIFNRTTGDLFYDADGSGAGEQVLLFNLTIVAGNFNYADIDVR